MVPEQKETLCARLRGGSYGTGTDVGGQPSQGKKYKVGKFTFGGGW